MAFQLSGNSTVTANECNLDNMCILADNKSSQSGHSSHSPLWVIIYSRGVH